jgi:hypothetical protein
MDRGGWFVRTVGVGWRLLVASLDCTGSWYYLINCKISSIDRIDRITLQSMSFLGFTSPEYTSWDPIINRMVSLLKMHYCASLSIARCLPDGDSFLVDLVACVNGLGFGWHYVT